MNPDEVIDYLSAIDKHKEELTTTGTSSSFPYLEYYYEYLINHGNPPDSYYTALGLLYIEKCFRLKPASLKNTCKSFITSHSY